MTIIQKVPEKPISEQLTELLSQLSYDQLRFVTIRHEFRNKKETAEALGLEPDVVYRWPKVVNDALKLIALETEEASRTVLKRNAFKAAMVKVYGLDSEDERVRQGAATEVLDRNLGKPTQPQEINLRLEKELEVIFDKLQEVLNPDDYHRALSAVAGEPDSEA